MWRVAPPTDGVVPIPMFDLTRRVVIFEYPVTFTLVVKRLEPDVNAFEMNAFP